MEPVRGNAVSDEQQGFLAGRSLLKHVKDVEGDMIGAALVGEHPVAIFYDFQAVFPSLSHTAISSQCT